MNAHSRLALRWASAFFFFAAYGAQAEPYLAVQLGLKCGQCHVNPSGGGLRTTFGDLFAQTVLPAQHLDTALDNWTGQLGPYLRAGGDFRFDASVMQVPHEKSLQQFAVAQTRIYLEADLIPNRFACSFCIGDSLFPFLHKTDSLI